MNFIIHWLSALVFRKFDTYPPGHVSIIISIDSYLMDCFENCLDSKFLETNPLWSLLEFCIKKILPNGFGILQLSFLYHLSQLKILNLWLATVGFKIRFSHFLLELLLIHNSVIKRQNHNDTINKVRLSEYYKL